MYQKVAYANGDGVDLVTSLPASPHDGQEIILTDSTTAGTYHWRLRYVSGRSSNKWVCVGGVGAYQEVETSESTSSTSYTALATAGPSFTVPLAGDYLVEIGFESNASTTTENWMSYAIGATAAADADGISFVVTGGSYLGGLSRVNKQSSLAASTALAARYKVTAGTSNFRKRWMLVTPVAVGG